MGATINLTEKKRYRLATSLGICHWVCILPSFICLITALFIQISIEDKIAFIENYNGAVLPGFLVFTGFYGFIAHVLCGKAIFTNRIVEKREKWSPFLLPAIIATAIIFLAEFIAGIMCFVHIGDLEDSFNDGIKKAMAAYKDDATTKEEMDVLQMGYNCCGSRGYEEWFSVAWVHPDYAESMATSSMNDVPFSCCNPEILRPCIRKRVHDNAFHYNYDYRTQTTLHTRGCTDVLMEFYENSVLTLAGALVLTLSFIQVFACIAGRFLQTAIAGSMANDDPDMPSVGYLFKLPNAGGQGGDMSMTTSDGETLGDSTVDTTLTDGEQERYTEFDMEHDATFDDDESLPMYENIPHEGDEENIYNEGEVEDYLAAKFANSRTKFEASMDSADFPPPMDEESPYANINPNMVKVRSRTGNYMAMNMSNSSRVPLANRRNKSWSSKPRGPSLERNNIHRHRFPSPNRYETFGSRSPLVINMARGFSPIAKPMPAKPRHSSPVRTKTYRRDKYVSPERQRLLSQPRRPFPEKRPPAFPGHLPRVVPMQWQARPVIQGIQVCPENPKISPRRKNRSPDRRISPVKSSFRSGVSYGCNHALE